MADKKQARLKRAKRSRMNMREANVKRLTILKTPRHMYAQVIDETGGIVLAAASTLEGSFKAQSTGNIGASEVVGELIAERAKAAGIESVVFDRAGFKYHGRVRALAEKARENGLNF